MSLDFEASAFMGTYVEVIRCPDCGAAVREIVNHGVFQVGGTSIGPPAIACPGCGVLVESGLSEWEDKSFLGRYWFFLRILLWSICGAIVLAGFLGSGGVWLLVERRWISPSAADPLRWIAFSVIPILVFWKLFRNAFQEIRASQERTRPREDAGGAA